MRIDRYRHEGTTNLKFIVQRNVRNVEDNPFKRANHCQPFENGGANFDFCRGFVRHPELEMHHSTWSG